MTVVPLPDVPCVRVKLDYNLGSPGEGGSRFYLSYSGSAPTAGNCATLATDVASAWSTNLAPIVGTGYYLEEVDVLDIASDTGLSGQWTGSSEGSNAGTSCPANCAVNIEYLIARRYRGGKPRMFLPPPPASDLASQTSWSGAFVSAANTAIAAFMAQIHALSIGAVGTLQHVNLSYYKGFTNISNSSGRIRPVPTYRATAVHDNVVGYGTKVVVGSQRRRRTATTP